MLGKDPSDIRISCFLNSVVCVFILGNREEGVIGENVKQGSFPNDLVDRVLDRRRTGVGDRVEVHGDDGDTVGELLDILAGRIETVKVVQVGESREKLAGTANLVTNNKPALSRVLNLEHFDDRSVTALDFVHDSLVHFEGVFARLFEERGVRNGSNVGCALGGFHRPRSGERASRDKVASELLGDGGRDGTGRSVSLESVSLFGRRVVQVKGIDPSSVSLVRQVPKLTSSRPWRQGLPNWRHQPCWSESKRRLLGSCRHLPG